MLLSAGKEPCLSAPTSQMRLSSDNLFSQGAAIQLQSSGHRSSPATGNVCRRLRWHQFSISNPAACRPVISVISTATCGMLRPLPDQAGNAGRRRMHQLIRWNKLTAKQQRLRSTAVFRPAAATDRPQCWRRPLDPAPRWFQAGARPARLVYRRLYQTVHFFGTRPGITLDRQASAKRCCIGPDVAPAVGRSGGNPHLAIGVQISARRRRCRSPACRYRRQRNRIFHPASWRTSTDQRPAIAAMR